MSRESLLDEAIAKAKEAEDWQLVEWLRMARGGESAARWYSDKLREAHRTERKLLDENAKLREERDMYRDLVGCMVHPDIPDQLYAENVKLRELVRMMLRVAGVAEYATDAEWQTITHYLRELGIEVEDE